MAFPDHLRTLRHERGLTQQQLADAANLQPLQIRRYESGKAQPMLTAIHNLAIALQCSTDDLIFGNTRGPQKNSLLFQMEAIEALPKKAQASIGETIDALIAWHQAQNGGRLDSI